MNFNCYSSAYTHSLRDPLTIYRRISKLNFMTDTCYSCPVDSKGKPGFRTIRHTVT